MTISRANFRFFDRLRVRWAEVDMQKIVFNGHYLAYADRLRAVGVPVELEMYRGLTHDFIKMGRALKEAGHAQRVAGEAFRRAWNP